MNSPFKDRWEIAKLRIHIYSLISLPECLAGPGFAAACQGVEYEDAGLTDPALRDHLLALLKRTYKGIFKEIHR